MNKIKELRKLNNEMTQQKLSDISGVKLATLQKLETGVNRFKGARFETICNLAKALNVPIEEFIEEE